MTQPTFTPSPSFSAALLGWRPFFMIDLDFVRDFDGEIYGFTAYTTTEALNEISDAFHRGFRISGAKVWDI